MRMMVEFINRSKTSVNAELHTLREELNQVEELSFSQLHYEQVQRLFNYGMNACGDHELVQDCLMASFVNIRNLPEPLSGSSIDSSLFKLFRGILIQQMADRRKSSATDVLENLFTARTAQVIRRLPGLQREAIYLKFNSGLSDREVSIVMES